MNVDGPKSWIKAYYPSFDGIRGLAILLVFIRHFAIIAWNWKPFYGMWIGVDLFFVLSGFLITGILYDTLREPHYFRNFYIRRALRIFPLYYLVLGISAFLILCTHRIFASYFFFSYALYAGNIVLPFVNLDLHNPNVVGYWTNGRWHQANFGYLWSLCVEEQFYLFWPMVVYLGRKRERLMQIALAGAAAAVILRSILAFTLPPVPLNLGVLYFSTVTRCDALLIGAWCSLWLRGTSLTRKSLRSVAYRSAGCSTVGLILGLYFTLERWPGRLNNPFINTAGYTLVAIAAASLILLSLDEESLVSQLLRTKYITRLGIISYGFYVLHDFPEELIGVYIKRHPALNPWRSLIVCIYFVVVYSVALLSYKYFETPFLNLKKRLAPSSQSGPPVQVFESQLEGPKAPKPSYS